MIEKLILKKMTGRYCVCRFAPTTVPKWVYQSSFFSISQSEDELSIVVDEVCLPDVEDFKVEKGWSLLKVEGVLDFSLTGILAAIANPLALNNISLFAISTFDTDYILIKREKLDAAIAVLRNNHLEVID